MPQPRRSARGRWQTAARVALGLLLALPAAATGPGGPAASRAAMLNEAIAGLGDEVYLRRDDAAVRPLALQAAQAQFEGLLLGAPRRVDAAREGRFSALLLAGRSAARARALAWETNAMLVAADVDRGAVFAGPLVVIPADKTGVLPPAPAPEPAGDPALEVQGEGHRAATVWLGLPELLDLPLRTSRLVLRVVHHDQVSNPAYVALLAKEPAAGPVPPADAAALIERLRQAGQGPLGLPAFRRGPQTPTLPTAAPGVAFELATAGAPSGALPLHAVLRLEATPAMTVQPPPAGSPPTRPPPPSALLRATVMVVLRDQPHPYLLAVEVPVWSAAPPAPRQLVDGAFSVDLATLLPPGAPRTGALVYVLAGRHIAGPQALVR